MIRNVFVFAAFLLFCGAMSAQTVSLTFTGRDANNGYVQLSRVVVTNVTRDWQETLYWPDTVLTMTATGIHDAESRDLASLRLSQNNPNPFIGTTYASLTVGKAGALTVEITDVTGRNVETQNFASLQQGTYQLRVTLSTAGVYFLTASMNGQVSSVKMVNGGSGGADEIVLNAHEGTGFTASGTQPKNAPKGTTPNPFVPGDQMKYVGYAMVNGSELESSLIAQAQTGSETLILLFTPTQGDGAPCPGAATVTDIDGNVYNTVQVGNQCWMRENLRTTRYADGTTIPMGSTYSLTEPYRYAPGSNQSNEENMVNVPRYGYLYNWPAVMHGASGSEANPSGVQGICPTGWHVPSDAEWTQLTNYVGSQSQYQCNGNSANIAKALASTTGWSSSTTTCTVGNDLSTNNATGFSALPAGCNSVGNYYNFGNDASIWSATENGGYDAYVRGLGFSYAFVHRGNYGKRDGFSVRCVRD